MKQNVIQRLAQKYIRKQDKIPSNWKQIKIWIKEFSEYADMVLVVKEDLEKKGAKKEIIIEMIEGFNSNRELGIGGNLVNKFAEEIKELLKSEKEKWENLTLERIKLKEETKLFDEDEWSEGYKGGYNQAIADLEKLKEALKKNYIIARLKDEK